MQPFASVLLASLALAAAAARGADYWLIKDETAMKDYCSLDGRGSNLADFSGWATAPDGTNKVPFGTSYGAVDPDGVYHMNGHLVRGKPASSKAYAFQGGELVFDGTNPAINDKMDNGSTLTIGNLRVVSGTHGEIRNGDNNHVKTLDGTNWVVEAGATLGLNTGDRGQTPAPRSIVCSATVSGEGTLAATAGIDGIASIGGSVTLTGDLSGFAGVLSAGEKGATYTGTHAEAVANHSLAVASPSAVPQATPGGRPLFGAVVATNGATISFACDATSPAVRGWDFGGGATPTVDVTNGCTVTVLGPVSGTAGLVKTGDGTLVLDAGGEGAFGRMVLAGETNVPPEALVAYAAACAPMFDDFPFGSVSLASASETAAAFSVGIFSTAWSDDPVSLAALVSEAGAGEGLRENLAAPSGPGPAFRSVSGLRPATDWEVRFVLSGATNGVPLAFTNAATAFRTAEADPVPEAALSVVRTWAAAAGFEIRVPRFGWGATGLSSLVLRYGTDAEDESGWTSVPVGPVPSVEGESFSFRLSGLATGKVYRAKLDVSNDLDPPRTSTTEAVPFETASPAGPDESQPLVEVASVAPACRAIRVSASVARTGFGAETVRVLYRVAETAAGLETAPDAVAHAALAAGADASFAAGGLPNGETRFIRVYAENALGVRTESAVFSAVPRGFDYGATLTVSGSGADLPAIADLPVPVRLADGSPEGFSYAALHSPSDGADLAFFDPAGVGLPFEIDTWDTNGTSLVWVLLPYAAGGTPFEMRWGSDVSGKDVCPDDPWKDYVGVWHLGEPGDGAAELRDSTENGLHAAATAASRAESDGRFGGARTPTRNGTGKNSHCLKVDLSEGNRRAAADGIAADGTGRSFTVSMWVRPQRYDGNGIPDAQFLVGRKRKEDSPAWAVQYHYDDKTRSSVDYGRIRVWGRETSSSAPRVFDFDDAVVPSEASGCLGRWFKYDVVYDGDYATFYVDGGTNAASVLEGTLPGGAAANGADDLYLAGTPDNTTREFCGDLDEVRIRAGAADAGRIAADWAAQTDPAFLSAGPARALEETDGPVAGLSVAAADFLSARLNASVESLGGGASSADVLVEVAREDAPGIPVWSASYSADVPGLRVLEVPGLAAGTAHLARIAVTNALGASAESGPLRFRTRTPGAPEGTASLLSADSTSFSVEATATGFGTGSVSARARLEVSESPSFDTFAGVSRSVVLPLRRPVALSVSRLVPGTLYHLRVVLFNDWNLETVVPLGAVSTRRGLYVDSLAPEGGDGTAPGRAVRTIRAALDAAAAGDTIWVRGGEGRAYGVTNETDTLPVPAELVGLSIRAYAETLGDGGRAPVAISDTYVADGNRAHVVSNRAADVTLEGLDFAFGTHSVGKQNVAGVSVVWTAAPFTTVERCRFLMSGPTTYAGSGTTPVVWAVSRDATNLVVRGCELRNTRCWGALHGYPPIKAKTNALIVGNVFSNVNATATAEQRDQVNGGEQACYGFSFVSNVVYGANEGSHEGNVAFLYPLYPGPKSGEIAYNRFVASPDNRAQNGTPLVHRFHVSFGAGYAEAFPGGTATDVHHNTFVGGSVALLFGDSQNKTRRNRVFSNLFLLAPGSTNLVENVAANATGFSGGRTTSFVAPSCLRNNAYTGVLAGGSAAELETWDLSGGMDVRDNVALAAPPEFVCTNDIRHADYYRPFADRHRGIDFGRIGWRGENGEFPLYVGALPPRYPDPTLLILR